MQNSLSLKGDRKHIIFNRHPALWTNLYPTSMISKLVFLLKSCIHQNNYQPPPFFFSKYLLLTPHLSTLKKLFISSYNLPNYSKCRPNLTMMWPGQLAPRSERTGQNCFARMGTSTTTLKSFYPNSSATLNGNSSNSCPPAVSTPASRCTSPIISALLYASHCLAQ